MGWKRSTRYLTVAAPWPLTVSDTLVTFSDDARSRAGGPTALHDATRRRVTARQGIYEALGTYRLSEYGAAEGACPHCIGEDEFRELRSTPIAQLSLEQVWVYCAAVWPSVSDFKYFLPRLLEVIDPGAQASDWQELGRKFPAQGWAVCSEPELEAVARYLTASDEHARLT